MSQFPLPLLLSLADVPRATQIMADAFQHDPLWQHAFPNAATRATVLPKFFSVLLTLGAENGKAYVAGDPNAGVTVWNFPGQAPSRLTLPTAGRLLLLLASPFLRAALKVRSVFAQFDPLKKKYAPDPHYYLETIGVSPEAQGKGLASKLIRPFLQQADARKLPAYTETVTPSNVSLYEYFGFEVKERVDIAGTGLSVWAFLRPASR